MEIKKPQLGKVGAFAIFLKREVLQHLPMLKAFSLISFASAALSVSVDMQSTLIGTELQIQWNGVHQG